MTDETVTSEQTKSAKKRTPKRMSADKLKARLQEKAAAPNYRGASPDNVQWDTLSYDADKKKQVVTINTVDADGVIDGNTRVVATSDLHIVKHTLEVSKEIQKKRSNARRRKKSD